MACLVLNSFSPNCVQYIQQEKREEDLPEDVLSVSLLKHQVIFFLKKIVLLLLFVFQDCIHFYALLCFKENIISSDGL